jgi:hypothetical protein
LIHAPDEGNRLRRDLRPSRFTRLTFSSPEEPKPLPVPGKDGLGPDDDERFSPIRPKASDQHPEEAVRGLKPNPLLSPSL